MIWFQETLYPSWRQTHEITQTLFQHRTEFQNLVIFENPRWGRALALDGVVQVTEGDEFVYHEMMAHVPILAHGAAEKTLIIGGGDGGVLREVLKHKGVKKATMVEIDRAVVDMCLKYMPSIAGKSFDDPRTDLVIADGIKFVAETKERFDVIIVDSTDPAGPGEVLFTPEFYASCKRCLTDKGIMITQNGVPMMQPEELTNTYRRMQPLFADVSFVMAAVPTYVGGFMSLAWASLDSDARRRPLSLIQERYAQNAFPTRYYTPEIHLGAFALPRYVSDLMK